MKLNECIKRNRYQIRKAIYRNRAHIGWVVVALICFSLWSVNRENRRLETENLTLRSMYTEVHNRLVSANKANELALVRQRKLESQHNDIINLLEGGGCAHQRQGHRPD